MENNKIALRPSYWASVSGGKDSLYMLNYILHNRDRYPLDGVVHFELDIDYPFIHEVIDYMESECKKFNIRFARIKPRKTWAELYSSKHKTGTIWGFPTRKARWCNNRYKLDAKRQLTEWLNSLGYYVIHYIGYCADEERRFNKRHNFQKFERYPLAENGITEDGIWETEQIRETELGRPFSVISSNPKYNADYLENIIKTKWLKILEEKEIYNAD